MTVRAPSVHNTQPWRWRILPDRIDLYADSHRHLKATDPLARAMVVSCGAALHHMEIAFAVLGWGVQIMRFPDATDRDLLASVRFVPRPIADTDIQLAAAILLRRSDRRRFPAGELPAGSIRAIAAAGCRLGAAARQMPERFLHQLGGPMREAADRHAIDPEYCAELAAWSGCHGAASGVPARNTPAARSADELPVRAFAGPELPEFTSAPDAAQWLVVCTPNDDRSSQLRAGEATSAMLLQAARLGLASSVQSEPLGMLDLRDQIRQSALHRCAYPHIMIRVGAMPSGASPLQFTPRRCVEEVIQVA
ncbi:Acg family FMN-binding oxidoreductase [Nocardia callitridis]